MKGNMRYRKIRSVLFLSFQVVLLLLPAVRAGEISADDILGTWVVEEDGEDVEKIEIYKSGEKYFGKIVWLKEEETTGENVLDKKNKNKALRNRPLLGLEVLKGYIFDGKDSWHDGEFYAYRKGRTVSPKLTLLDSLNLRIQVKILFVKKSFIWKRVVSAEN